MARLCLTAPRSRPFRPLSSQHPAAPGEIGSSGSQARAATAPVPAEQNGPGAAGNTGSGKGGNAVRTGVGGEQSGVAGSNPNGGSNPTGGSNVAG